MISKEITRDLINLPTSWIANSKKIKDKDCYSFFSLFFILLPFNMVRKISWWLDPGNPHQDSWRERKRYFFWFSSWKINYHHSFNILSDIHLEWVFCSLASLFSLIFFSIVAHSYLFLSEQKPRKNNDIKNNNIFLLLCINRLDYKVKMLTKWRYVAHSLKISAFLSVPRR